MAMITTAPTMNTIIPGFIGNTILTSPTGVILTMIALNARRIGIVDKPGGSIKETAQMNCAVSRFY